MSSFPGLTLENSFDQAGPARLQQQRQQQAEVGGHIERQDDGQNDEQDWAPRDDNFRVRGEVFLAGEGRLAIAFES